MRQEESVLFADLAAICRQEDSLSPCGGWASGRR